MTGLLDWLAAQCRCEISDLPRKLDTVRWLTQETGDAQFPLPEWEEAAAYLFGAGPPPFPSVQAAKAYFWARREPAPPRPRGRTQRRKKEE